MFLLQNYPKCAQLQLQDNFPSITTFSIIRNFVYHCRPLRPQCFCFKNYSKCSEKSIAFHYLRSKTLLIISKSCCQRLSIVVATNRKILMENSTIILMVSISLGETSWNWRYTQLFVVLFHLFSWIWDTFRFRIDDVQEDLWNNMTKNCVYLQELNYVIPGWCRCCLSFVGLAPFVNPGTKTDDKVVKLSINLLQFSALCTKNNNFISFAQCMDYIVKIFLDFIRWMLPVLQNQ